MDKTMKKIILLFFLFCFGCNNSDVKISNDEVGDVYLILTIFHGLGVVP
jgi:hypothetical protein